MGNQNIQVALSSSSAEQVPAHPGLHSNYLKKKKIHNQRQNIRRPPLYPELGVLSTTSLKYPISIIIMIIMIIKRKSVAAQFPPVVLLR